MDGEIPNTGEVNRRDVLKLISAVAALGAGLAVSVDAQAAESPVRLEFKFYGKVGNNPAEELLHTLEVPDEVVSKMLKISNGNVALRVYRSDIKTPLLITQSSIKLGKIQTRTPRRGA